MKNALTIDVEDYFQVAALAPVVPRASWEGRVLRVERNVARILTLLADHGAKATFFTLAWVAERCPGLVREIVAAGHELASHGFGHERAGDQGPQAFFADILRARQVLEQLSGVAVRGYRAPSFSISTATPWAHELIAQAGYRYSSSVYPVKHDHYGIPDFPRFARQLPEGVGEIPVSTVRVFGRNFPAGGGGFFRLLPYEVSRRMIARLNRFEHRAAVFYLHPWELDPDQPRLPGLPFKSRFRHYLNLSATEARLARLLRDFSWGRMDQVFAQVWCEA